MGVGLRPAAAVKMFESSCCSSRRHRGCYCFWRVALMVTLLAFMASVCDIARAQEEEESRRERFLLANGESTAATSTTAAVGDDSEDEEGDGPNTRIAKAVEYWLPFALGGVLFLFLLGCFIKSFYRATRRARDGQAADGKSNEEKVERNYSNPRRNLPTRDRQQSQHPRKKSSDYYLPSLYIPAQDGHNSTTSSSSAYRSHRDETKWSSPIDVSKAMRSSFSGGGVSGSIHDPHRSYRSSSSAVCPSERSPPSLQRRQAGFDVGVFYSNRMLDAGGLGRENGNPSLERSLSLKSSSASARNLGNGRSSNKINTMVLSASLSEGLFVGDELQGKKAPGEKGDVHRNPMAKHLSARSSDPVAASSVGR